MRAIHTNPKRHARAYSSAVRAEYAAQTRERILEAVIEQLQASEELSLPRAALRAGVSVPTVYRHFPTKQALIEALTECVDQKLTLTAVPTDVDDFDRFVPKLFAVFDQNEKLVRARRVARLLKDIHAATQRRRATAIIQAMRSVTRRLDPLDARRACAIVRTLVSGNAWEMMHDSFDLSGPEAGEAVAWAIRVLVAELRRDPGSMKRGAIARTGGE